MRIILGKHFTYRYRSFFSSWLIGYFIISFFLCKISLYQELDYVFLCYFTFLLFIIILFLKYYLQFIPKNLPKEKSSDFYYLLALILFFSLLESILKYEQGFIPNSEMIYILHELSFANSFLFGINKNRERLLYFKEPFMINKYVREPILPLIYETTLCAISGNFLFSHIAITILNRLAAAFFLYDIINKYTRWRIFVFIFYFLNNGLSFFIFKMSRDLPESADIVHEIGKEFTIPNYQMFSFICSGPVFSSFSIAMGLFVMALIHNYKINLRLQILIAQITAFIPIPSLSLALFIILISRGYFLSVFIFICLFFIRILLTAEPSFYIFSIATVFQMNGFFFPYLFVFVMILGLQTLALFSFHKFRNKGTLILGFLISIIFTFLREVNSTDNYISSFIVIYTVFMPFWSANFSFVIHNFYYSIQKPKFQGFFVFLIILLIIVYIVSYYITLSRICSNCNSLISSQLRNYLALEHFNTNNYDYRLSQYTQKYLIQYDYL